MPEEQRQDLLERLRNRRERHAERGKLYRTGFAIAGFLVLVLGIVLVPLPGPGLLVVAVGLAMLALEFRWAERMLERAVRRLDAATDVAKRATPIQRALGVVVLLLGAATTLAAVVLWDIPLLPV